jgi:hypothetical protein
MLTHELNCILLLDYKFTLPLALTTTFLGLKVYMVGKEALLFLPETPWFDMVCFKV